MASGRRALIPGIPSNLLLGPCGFFFLAGALHLQPAVKLLLWVLSKMYSSCSVQTDALVTLKCDVFKSRLKLRNTNKG